MATKYYLLISFLSSEQYFTLQTDADVQQYFIIIIIGLSLSAAITIQIGFVPPNCIIQSQHFV